MERMWKQVLKASNSWDKRIGLGEDKPRDAEGKIILYPNAKLRIRTDYGAIVVLDQGGEKSFKKHLSVERYSLEERKALTIYGDEWKEPSDLLDGIVADFRHELELMMREAMPWDGEY